MRNQWTLRAACLIGLGLLGLPAASRGAGTLTPKGSVNLPIQIRDHHVDIVIDNGFARTEVTQTFHNPNPNDLEAVYSFPLPKSASLSEVTIFAGEKTIHGEVIEKQKARDAYEKERDQGNDAGLAEKDQYKTFQFSVSPVRAGAETRLRFLYYQPLEIDTGIGRYHYPLQEGGTDEAGAEFWTMNEQVEENFTASIEVKSAWPIDRVRLPGFDDVAQVTTLGTGHQKVRIEKPRATLSRDLILYYRLQDGLPGRVELIPFRDDPASPGTFMLVVTPGLDLKPIPSGADYTFVLDVSGSMETKLSALARGMKKVLGELKEKDRYRLITFNGSANDLTSGYVPVNAESVAKGIAIVESLRSGGGTNLYAGLALALTKLDDDRATSLVLVTDGVANVGPISGKAFQALVKQFDVRVFGFLMGNSGNWPLLRAICDTTGGFSASISNDDDIVGQLLLAKSKITSECLHDATLRISGVKTSDTTAEVLGKVYRGQQLVVFGRYEKGGRATLKLEARLTGEDKMYTTTFDFPDLDKTNPEIERLWAMSRIEHIEALEKFGEMPEAEAATAIADLGVEYQLVTDHTSMLVLSDDDFAKLGIDRRNRDRVAKERLAQAALVQEPPRSRRVDEAQPMFHQSSPSLGHGAIDPVSGVAALLLAGVVLVLSLRHARASGVR